MNKSLEQRLLCWSLISVFCAALFQAGAAAESIPVRHVEGTVRGFLELCTQEGHRIAVGDLIQTVHGERVISRLTFRFRDGSIDDETTVFSQRHDFKLISDHHLQKGPSFPHPTDVSIDVRSGQVTIRSKEKDGKEKLTSEHVDLPPDLSNGILLSIVKNIRPDTPETKVSMVVGSSKPRIVKLAISPQGEEPFSVAGSHRKAMHYRIKIELGGVDGVVAPLIGKAPTDINFWIDTGKAPAFVKEEGSLYEGGPIWIIQLTSPVPLKAPSHDQN